MTKNQMNQLAAVIGGLGVVLGVASLWPVLTPLLIGGFVAGLGWHMVLSEVLKRGSLLAVDPEEIVMLALLAGVPVLCVLVVAS